MPMLEFLEQVVRLNKQSKSIASRKTHLKAEYDKLNPQEKLVANSTPLGIVGIPYETVGEFVASLESEDVSEEL